MTGTVMAISPELELATVKLDPSGRIVHAVHLRPIHIGDKIEVETYHYTGDEGTVLTDYWVSKCLTPTPAPIATEEA